MDGDKALATQDAALAVCCGSATDASSASCLTLLCLWTLVLLFDVAFVQSFVFSPAGVKNVPEDFQKSSGNPNQCMSHFGAVGGGFLGGYSTLAVFIYSFEDKFV